MSDDLRSANPFFAAWLDTQSKMLEAQAPFWQQMSETVSSTPAGEALVTSAEKLWSKARAQSEEWTNQLMSKFNVPAGGDEGIARDTLQRMFDPNQFLYAGSDEINQTIQKLVEGPEFADIGMLERRTLKITQEWLALREASAEYRMVTAKAWGKAYERFSKIAMSDPDLWKDGARAATDRWLEIANEELIASQRTEAFLTAQRKLLRAGVDYRMRSREMMELWCETHSIPTRSEIDDLHAMVYRLRRDVRDLKKALSARAKRAPKKRTTTTKRGA